MNGLEKLVDDALQAEVDAVLSYRQHLDNCTGVWDSTQMLHLLDLHKAKEDAHDRARELLGRWHEALRDRKD